MLYRCGVSYRRSEPLNRWLGPRAEAIGTLASGHAKVGEVSGRGRPLDTSKPIAHAYVIVMLSQFQGFVRDLHDLAVEHLVTASGASPAFVPILSEGLTIGRGIDRGNATNSTVKSDFGRLGLSPFDMSAYNARWANPGTDSRTFDLLLQLRNALGHGNEANLNLLLAAGTVKDTVTWARDRLPVLNRYARALDHMVWDHLVTTTGTEPWT